MIGIEETEDEDEIEDNEILQNLDTYEERLDSTMLDIHESYDASDQQSLIREGIKQESYCEGDGSEIQMEEIEMDSVISEENHMHGVIKSEHAKTTQENSIEFTGTDNILDKQNVCTIVSQDDTTLSVEDIVNQAHLVSEPTCANSKLDQTPVRLDTAVNAACTTLQREPESNTRTSDSDEKFLLSCAPILRRLPNKKNQLARLRIQQLLFELEYDEKYNS